MDREPKDLHAGMTRFFHDPQWFDELRDNAIAPLLRDKRAAEPVRVWVPGCGTGEDAYSLAMVFLEQIVESKKDLVLQVFATDRDRDALVAARNGVYPAGEAADLSSLRLKRFFIQEGDVFQIDRRLREHVIFAAHDLLDDPPFSSIDLIFCRALPPTLSPEAREKALLRFQYSVRPGGFLLLEEEDGRVLDRQFEPVSSGHNLYRRLSAPAKAGSGRASLKGAGPKPAQEADRRPPRAKAAEFTPRKGAGRTKSGGDRSTDAALRRELRAAREALKSSNDRLEAALRELAEGREKLALMSASLSASTADLENARMDRLSTNQELVSVNAEHREQLKELNVVNDDLANLFDSLSIVTILLDGNLRLRKFTQNASRLFHVTRADVGREIGSIGHELAGMDLVCEVKKVFDTLEPLEKEVRAENGEWYTVRIFPYRTQDERVDGVVITLADVSRVKRAEEFAENVIATVSTPLVVLDASFRAIAANDAFYKDFGVEPAAVVSKSIFELMDRQWDTQALRGSIQEILSKGAEIWGLEFQAETRLGRRNLSLNARRLVGGGGEPEMILLALEDVTERKRAERTLIEAGRTLSEQMRSRTRLAFSLMEEENIQRKRFAQVLHDNIQQLIVAAKMGLDGLLEKTTEIELRKSIRLVQEPLKRAMDSARSLTAELSPPILYQAGLVKALEWLCREMHDKSALGVDCSFEVGEEPQNEGIRAFIFQSARELLSNVVRYANVKKAKLRMTRSGDLLTIEVEDSGVGIVADRLKMIEKGSAGFGLFNIRERLSLLGGKIDIRTSRGAGTVVSLSVPLRENAKADDVAADGLAGPDSAGKQVPDAETPRAVPPIRVLLVDDHPIVRQGIAIILKNAEDIEVVGEAGDGQHALDLARRLKPNIVIMDVSMPDMSGAEATKRLLSELPQVKVIGLSMHVEKEMAAMMRNAGAVAYLTKGGPSEDLVMAIRQYGALELFA